MYTGNDLRFTTRARDLLAVGRPRVVDLFDAWLFAENDATLALGNWWAAPPPEHKADAYAGYVAARDREERAADVLRLAVSPRPG
jgi:hypothetical protein